MKKNLQTAAEVKTNTPAKTETTLVVAKTNEQTPTTKTEEQKPGETTEDAKRIGEPKTVKDIIEKNQRINRCLEKMQSINEASKSLDSFNLGSSRIKDTLEIADGRGNRFETSKTDLIEDVINFLKNRVEVKTAEVEAELIKLETA